MTTEPLTNGHPTNTTRPGDRLGLSMVGTGHDHAARIRTLSEQLRVTEGRAAAAEADRDRTAQATATAYRALELFKAEVREVALEVKDRQDWCDDGFNEAMARLGLPELTRTWSGTAVISVRVEGTTDEDTARHWVREALRSQDSDVEITDLDDIALDAIN